MPIDNMAAMRATPPEEQNFMEGEGDEEGDEEMDIDLTNPDDI